MGCDLHITSKKNWDGFEDEYGRSKTDNYRPALVRHLGFKFIWGGPVGS